MARCASCLSINRGPNTPGRRCMSCQGPMVFDPKVDGFSDLRLLKAMDRLSMQGQLAFTETQLFSAVSGRKTVGPSIGQRLRRKPKRPKHTRPTIGRLEFSGKLDRWLSVGGETRGRLLRTHDVNNAPNRQPVGGVVPPEIAAHGFDRAVVVDRADVAVMLVANNFHIDNRCAVISSDGYPEAFLGSLLELLNRNPNLVVAVAHGAAAESMDLAQRIRTWFPSPSIRLLEVGLRPAQVMTSNLYSATPAADRPDPAHLTNPALARLDETEREWLAWGLSTELASLPPSLLMRVLSRVFHQLARVDEQRLTQRNRLDRDRDHDDYGSGDLDAAWPGILLFDGGSSVVDGSAGSAGSKLMGLFDDGEGLGFDGADFDGDG